MAAPESDPALLDRLRELEDTLTAIRGGEVDALVVDGQNGTQVFTLRGAEEPYRVLVEQMHEGALTLAADGTIAYSNRAFARFVDFPLEQIVGKPLTHFLSESQRELLPIWLRDCRREGVRAEVDLLCASEQRPAILSLSLLAQRDVEAYSAIITDLRQQRRSEELEIAERFARSILEQATEAVFVCDRDGAITHMSRAADALISAAKPASIHAALTFLEEGSNDAASPVSPDYWPRAALGGRSIHGVEVRTKRSAGEPRHFLLSAAPLRDRRERCIGCIVSLTDITERKLAEARQRLLIDELNHRVKNTLAAVQSIAVQTARTMKSPAAFRQAFDSRLLALAGAHDLITQRGWQGAALSDIARQTLRPFVDGNPSRMMIEGAEIDFSPNAAVIMSMGLHELATNAVKYGAWSASGGYVALQCRIDRSGSDPMAEIIWHEHGGPPVIPPTRRGFGSRLLKHGVALELDGTVDLDYAPAGLICTARVKLSERVRVR